MRPPIDEFKKISDALHGNVTLMAKYFETTRAAIYKWLKKHEYRDAVTESRMDLFYECFERARLVALGIPNIDANGKLVGWKEKPDTKMLMYFIDRLGKKEGYGRQVDINTKNTEMKQSDARTLTKHEFIELFNQKRTHS